MRPINILITIIILLVVTVVVGYSISSTKKISNLPGQENLEKTFPPVFVWRYEKAKTLNLDGLPETDIFLEARYPNGKVESKLIDTTPGGCNDLPDADKDSAPDSTNIQCYSAGLGYRFKITKGEESYFVKRKMFEEASPDYNPPTQEYQVVAEFPIAK